MSIKELRNRVLLVGIIILLVSGVWVYALPISFDTYVIPGCMVSEADALIFTDPDTGEIFLRNGTTSEITNYGTGNIAATINAAIDQLPDGGTIQILPQTNVPIGYDIIDTILVDTDNIVIVGDGPNTIFDCEEPRAVFQVTANYVRIESLTINYAIDHPLGVPTYGILIDGAGNVTDTVIRDVYFGLDYESADVAVRGYQTVNTLLENVVVDADNLASHTTDVGFEFEDSYDVTLLTCQVKDVDNYGASFTNVQGLTILGGMWVDCGDEDLYLTSCEGVSVSGATFTRSAPDAGVPNNLRLDGSGIKVSGCYLYGAVNGVTVNAGSSGVVIDGNHFSGIITKDVVVGAANDVLISHNTFSKNDVTDGGTATIITGNHDYTTENSGTGSILSGVTLDEVAHGCDYTPDAGDVTITFTENPTNSAGTSWVTANATHIIVNVENDPGASNLDFAWSVRRNP